MRLNLPVHPIRYPKGILTMEAPDLPAREKRKSFLSSHYERLRLDIDEVPESRLRMPFDAEMV